MNKESSNYQSKSPGLKQGNGGMKKENNLGDNLRLCKRQPDIGNKFTPKSAGEVFQLNELYKIKNELLSNKMLYLIAYFCIRYEFKTYKCG